MLVYEDYLCEGEEVASDSYPPQEHDDKDIVLAIQGKMIAKGGETFDTGANASAEEAGEDLADEIEQVCNVVDTHQLHKMEFEKKEYKALQKVYWKKLIARFQEEKDAEALATLKKNFKRYQEWVKEEVLGNFDEFDFYVSEKAVLEDGCLIIPARWVGSATAPLFYFIKSGLKEHKF